MRRFRAVVASTDEVSAERGLVDRAAERINKNLRVAKIDTLLEISRWERDVGLGMDRDGPQGLVDKGLRIPESDILIGILWSYFGQRTANGQTPTEHEIRDGYAAWKKTGLPHLLLFFRQGAQPTKPGQTEQLLAVQNFQSEFMVNEPNKGIIKLYNDLSEFSESLYDNLWRICVTQPIQSVAEATPSTPRVLLEPKPRLLRSNGITELLGDFVFTLSGGELTPGPYDLTFFVKPNVMITGSIQANRVSTAFLSLVSDSENKLLAYGQHSTVDSLRFEDLNLGPANENERFCIRNVRVNASQIGIPPGTTRQIYGVVILRSRETGESIFTAEALLGVTAGPAYSFGVETILPADSIPWISLPEGTSLSAPDNNGKVRLPRTFDLRFKELLSAAFKTRREEAGYPSLEVDHSSGTTSGTRFLVRFKDVPPGIRMFVTHSSLEDDDDNALLVQSDPNGAGGQFIPTNRMSPLVEAEMGRPLTEVSILGGAGQAVWEWLRNSEGGGSSIREICFGVALARRPGLIASGSITVNGTLAPISATPTAGERLPVPRFVDTAENYLAIRLVNTMTRLLFPFVTNQAGFDTGISIVNTTFDPFGTPLQTGECRVNFYGVVGNSDVNLCYPSPSITGGQHFTWVLSVGGAVTATPGFQGYIIVECSFPARGLAFIFNPRSSPTTEGIVETDGKTVASCYVAEVMEDR